MSKHTPGPWHEGMGNGIGNIFCDGDDRMRMTDQGTTLWPVCKMIDGFDTEQDFANARLIAKSPALYAACKAILHCDAMGDFSHPLAVEEADAEKTGTDARLHQVLAAIQTIMAELEAGQ